VSNESDNQYQDDRERLLEEIRRRAEEAELNRLEEEERAQRQEEELPPPIEEPLAATEAPPPSPLYPPNLGFGGPGEVDIQPQELLQEAQQFYQNEQYDKALELVGRVLDVFPGLGEASKLQDNIIKSRRLADVVREEARHRAEHLEPLPPPPPEEPKKSGDRQASDFWGPETQQIAADGITIPVSEPKNPIRPTKPVLDRAAARLSRVRIPVKPILISCAALVLAVVGYIIIDSLVHAVAPPQHVILVLPATAASADESQVLLADGFTEDIIQILGRATDLRVIGAQSAFNIRTSSVRPQQLARNLRASYTLAIGFRQAGEGLACTVVLSDTATGSPLLRTAFESTSSELANHRLNVARMITEALRVQLPAAENPLAAQTQPSKIQSYGLYLQARGLLRSSNPDALERSIELLQVVVQTDSSWGEGWAALGWATMLNMERNQATPRSEAVSALPYIQRAVARGARFAETFRAWGVIEMFNANYAKAVERYQTAIELCPGDAEALQREAQLLVLRGKKEEALQVANSAAEWDPLNANVLTTQGLVWQFNGDYRAAERSYSRAMQVARDQAELASDLHTDVLVYLQQTDESVVAATDKAARRRDDPFSHYRFGRVSQIAGQPIAIWQGILNQTLELIALRLRQSPDNAEMLTLQALTYTRLGQRKDALDANSHALRVAPGNIDVLYGTARMYALQREQKQAVAYLTHAIDKHYDLACVLDMDFYNLRADPDFLRAITR
jgi:TolB-like protein/tetratricopeptide (TPR) repeat protein